MSSVKTDCFAYVSKKNKCKALRELYCAKEDCKFYKTSKQRCRECKETGASITCEQCVRMLLK